MAGGDRRQLGERTISDFGEQWTHFPDNAGYYGSGALFADICGPLLTADDIRGRRVAEIGSGTGRIVGMLVQAGAEHVVAIEPSAAYEVLKQTAAAHRARVECLRIAGDKLPRDRALDLVVSIGVLHHIPDVAPVVRAAYEALRPGGRLLVWLYGHEGNEAYLALTVPLRAVSTRLPHRLVLTISRILNALLTPYIALCRHVPLPLRGYLLNVFGKMERDKRVLIVYDQLKPAYARYYRRHEAVGLLASAGFADVRVHHRHGYSWTVIGTRI